MAQAAELIKYEGDNSTFIWKHPLEDFDSLTQLVVHESQEALFFMNGQALDLFGPGRYTLETQNMPEVSRFLRRPAGDRTPFHCEVYFINKVEQMAIKWGTDSKVQYMEPTYHFPISLGASGEMSLRTEDSRRLLLKLVGTERELSQQKLTGLFRAFLMTRVKSYIAKFMTENAVSIFEVDQNLAAFSDALKTLLSPDFAAYGVALEQFLVTGIVKPEGDRQYEKFRELHFRQFADVAEAKLRQQVGLIDQQTASQRLVMEAEAIAKKRALEGYTYQQERGFDVAEQAVKNEAAGQFTNMGMGLGMMTGVGGALGGMVGGMMSGAVNGALTGTETPGAPAASKAGVCPKCGAALPEGAKFCLACGAKIEPPAAETLVCPSCGKTTPRGKFCIECGAPLEQKCPACGAELPPGAKFCLECGQKI